MATYIALLRGINVGRAKRVSMSDLRDLVTGLGHANVRTLLNSGNVVFEGSKADTDRLAARIETTISSTFGFSSRVIVVTASDLSSIIDENPLREATRDPARFLVAFASSRSTFRNLEPLTRTSWKPDRLSVGTRAAYIWCPNGIGSNKLLKAIGPVAGEEITTRNWTTVLKLKEASDKGP